MTIKELLVQYSLWLGKQDVCCDDSHDHTGDVEWTEPEMVQAFVDQFKHPLPELQDKIVVKIHEGTFGEDDIVICWRLSSGQWLGRNVRQEDLA